MEPPYSSVADLPSFVEMRQQLATMKLLTHVVARDQRAGMLELEAKIDKMARTADSFYNLLGPRNWVLHGSLNWTEVERIVEECADPEKAEKQFISLFSGGEHLRFMVMQLRRFKAFDARMHLIRYALDDYAAGRFYAVTLTLISVMDGFVNDFENERRGLHTRDADEMAAWDSVAGHHLGLTNAHKSFTKSFKKLHSDEVYELYRHGIVHGNVVSFDNVIVATKAFNRLFALADWASSRLAETAPVPPKATFREIVQQERASVEARKALSDWLPRVVARGDEGFSEQEVVRAATDYLMAWKRRNYGRMASLISPTNQEDDRRRTPLKVRKEVEATALNSFEVVELDLDAPAVSLVKVQAVINGKSREGVMRWIRYTTEGEFATPNIDGSWLLESWGPHAMFDLGLSDYFPAQTTAPPSND